jgi:hypothetical protein
MVVFPNLIAEQREKGLTIWRLKNPVLARQQLDEAVWGRGSGARNKRVNAEKGCFGWTVVPGGARYPAKS